MKEYLRISFKINDFKDLFFGERNYEREVEQWLFGKRINSDMSEAKSYWSYRTLLPISMDTEANLAFVRRNWRKIAYGLMVYEAGRAQGKDMFWPLDEARKMAGQKMRKAMEEEEGGLSPSF